MAREKFSINIRVVVLAIALLAVNAFLVFSFSNTAERTIADQIQSRMLDSACTAASLLDGDSIALIDSADMKDPAYKDAYEILDAFQDNAGIKYIYCLRDMGNGEFAYIVDPAEGDEATEYGTIAMHTDALQTAAEGEAATSSEAYEDRWGRFYSAYCPVFNSQGEVSGIVGVDFEASWYDARVAQFDQMALINCFVSLLMALIAAIVVGRMAWAEYKHTQRLLEANRFDSLTGLSNMGYFFERAIDLYIEMTDRGQTPVILYLNIMGMKYFNDKWGFEEGDRFLRAFADLLVKHFGRERCAYFGQDRFCVSTNDKNLNHRLDAFIGELEELNDGKTVPVCIGVYHDKLGKVGIGPACDRARAASEVNSGDLHSSYTYVDEGMVQQFERRQYVIDNLDRAIAEGWIQVHYQPIVRSSTGKVCDEEALARWFDPVYGKLSPTDFIPVLEDAKIAYKLDLCILEQALTKMKMVAEAGHHVVSVSINLSRSDFESCDIVEEVCTRVDAAGIDHGKINIEITETALGLNYAFMSEQVERFHELGFAVWMDDFGCEYSSLDYLQSLPFDAIKLDMGFMRRFDTGVKTKIILTELVKMALSLDIDTIAEGVETQDQVEFLREVGCGMMQGFYFSAPNSLQEVLRRFVEVEIGYEDPAQASYYSILGRVNLYDLASIARSDFDDGLQRYFDTLPMAIVETKDDWFSVMRCNKTCREFVQRVIGDGYLEWRIPFSYFGERSDSALLEAIRRCREEEERAIVDVVATDGTAVHAFVRRLAVNPVTGVVALAVAILSVSWPTGDDANGA